MNDQGLVIRELERAATNGECVVLASIVRTEGSAYRGVGTRMIVRAAIHRLVSSAAAVSNPTWWSERAMYASATPRKS